MRADQSPWTSGADPLTPADPESVGGHRLLGRLGEGGMGAVYLALAPDGRQVAVKVVRPELAAAPAFRARFAAEVDHARRVASFCTARVLDHGVSGGSPYLVTEYIDGPSLADHVAARGPLAPAPLRALAVGVATALVAIHAVRLVHRDLKPRNVMLSATGPRVIDFGIARALDSDDRLTRTGGVVGSPGWAAPEQVFDGQAGPAADVFAWGALVAYAATGRNPYGTGNLATLAARAQQGRHDLTGVPAEFQTLVRAALEPDPARRPAAQALLSGLVSGPDPERAATAVIAEGWSPERPAAPAPAARRPRPLWLTSLVSAAATAVVVGAVSAGAVALLRDDAPDEGAGHGRAAAAVATTPGPTRRSEYVGPAKPCAIVSPSLLEALTPGAEARPTTDGAVQDASLDGAQTGCAWTAEKRSADDGSGPYRLQQLIARVKVRRSGAGRDGPTEAARDFAAEREKLKKRSRTTSGGLRYGQLQAEPGLGSEAFRMSAQGDDHGRTASATVEFRLDNAVVSVIYSYNFSPDTPDPSSIDLNALEGTARDRALRAARDLAANLAACGECRA